MWNWPQGRALDVTYGVCTVCTVGVSACIKMLLYKAQSSVDERTQHCITLHK